MALRLHRPRPLPPVAHNEGRPERARASVLRLRQIRPRKPRDSRNTLAPVLRPGGDGQIRRRELPGRTHRRVRQPLPRDHIESQGNRL